LNYHYQNDSFDAKFRISELFGSEPILTKRALLNEIVLLPYFGTELKINFFWNLNQVYEIKLYPGD